MSSPTAARCTPPGHEDGLNRHRAVNALNRSEMQITVDTPRPPYTPARPTVVRGGDAGFEPATAEIMVGQSIVAHRRHPCPPCRRTAAARHVKAAAVQVLGSRCLLSRRTDDVMDHVMDHVNLVDDVSADRH